MQEKNATVVTFINLNNYDPFLDGKQINSFTMQVRAAAC